MGISFNSASLLSGNGIDVSQIVSEMQAAESGQLTSWQGDLTTLQNQASALGSINTDLSNLLSAVQALNGTDTVLTQMSAASSESAVVTATAQNGAAAGNYSVEVSTLASAGTLYTASVSSATSSILPSGQTAADLTLQIGGSTGTTADIPITQGSNDTLTTLAQSINSLSSTNNWGITASVVTDASGSRLAIYSNNTGSPGALSVSNNTTTLTFEPPVGGTDATVTINGIPYESTSNTISGAVPDVTFSLTSAAPTTPVTIQVAPDTDSINNAINNFVAGYNVVIDAINSQFSIDSSTGKQGPLGSDTNLRVLQSSLLNDLTYATTDSTSTSSGFSNLASLGISMNDDGTLTVDTATLDSALTSNPSAVGNFFSNTNSTGFADHFLTDLNALTAPSTGILNSDLAANQNQQSDLTNEIDDFQTQLSTQAAALTQELDQVNTSLEEYPLLLQEVTVELESLNSNSSTTGVSINENTSPTAGTSSSGSPTGSASS